MNSRISNGSAQDRLPAWEKFENVVTTLLRLFIVAPMILVMTAVYAFAYLVGLVAAQHQEQSWRPKAGDSVPYHEG